MSNAVAHRLFQVLLFSGCMFGASTQATAKDCALDPPPQVSVGAYDPAAPFQNPVGWSLRASGDSGCVARLQVDLLDAAGSLLLQGPDGTGLRVVLSMDAAGTAPLAAAPQDFATLQLAAGQQTVLPLWILRAPGQWLSPGLYRATVRLTLLDSKGKTLDKRDVGLQANVSPTVRAQFGSLDSASGSNSARLDFGELAQGAVRSASLSVQANTGHAITLESAQRGQLVNRRFAQARIGYELRLNGSPVALSAAVAGVRIASPGKARHQIDVQIGPVERVLAGEYADDLLITITAQ